MIFSDNTRNTNTNTNTAHATNKQANKNAKIDSMFSYNKHKQSRQNKTTNKMSENTNKRPTRRDKEVVAAAVDTIFPNIKIWLKQTDPAIPEDELQEAREETQEVLADSFGSDGYALAKTLDDYHSWDADSGLVELMDDAGTALYSAHKKACEEWVKTSGLTEIPIGTKVRHASQHKELVGEVVSNYPSGSSSVYYEALGHVRSGLGTHGCIFNWEDLTVVV